MPATMSLTDIMTLRDEVLSSDLGDVLARIFFEKVPFIFGGSIEHFRKWRVELAALLQVDAYEIVVVGSAAAGCSLSPRKKLVPFGDQSDIDVAIISEYHFSEAWHFLRGVDLTLASLTPAQRNAIREHQLRFIYWGCIATDKILSVLPFGLPWMKARSRMSDAAPTQGREINFRVYKDFRALRSYHLMGLRILRDSLLE